MKKRLIFKLAFCWLMLSPNLGCTQHSKVELEEKLVFNVVFPDGFVSIDLDENIKYDSLVNSRGIVYVIDDGKGGVYLKNESGEIVSKEKFVISCNNVCINCKALHYYETGQMFKDESFKYTVFKESGIDEFSQFSYLVIVSDGVNKFQMVLTSEDLYNLPEIGKKI